MKIALIGSGKTGSEVENLLKDSNKHELISVSTKHTGGLDLEGIKRAEVVIDFSTPEVILENIRQVIDQGKNMVVGTSGWYDHLEEVKKWVDEKNVGLIYGQNFSIGTNIFFQLVSQASKLASEFGDYDVYGFEIHHKDKADSPSATALKISDEIIESFPKKKIVQVEKLDRKIEEEELHFASLRGGRNPGMHKVVFDSEGDQITLEVASHNRKTYAQGAVLAAEFILGKTGFFAFDELFK